MTDEVLVNRLYDIVGEITRLGGEQERTSIVPGILVADASPNDLPTGWIKIVNPRDGTYVPCQTIAGLIVNDNDLVNVLFTKGTEPVALSQSPTSPSNTLKVSEVWDAGFDTVVLQITDAEDVGIGTSGPDAKLDILDTGTQLRLTHTDGSKFADFTLDTNHDLTIKPSSTGQIKLQPTIDSTDFFQILDADGGTPTVNVDSINEYVGIKKNNPKADLDVDDTFNIGDELSGYTGVFPFVINHPTGGLLLHRDGTGAAEGFIIIENNTSSSGGQIRGIDGGGLRFTNYNGVIEKMRIDNDGNVGIGVQSPQGLLHGYDSISGFLHWEYDGLDGTSRTIIPNGAGDVLYELFGMYVLRDSSGNTASGTFTVSNGGSTGLVVGGNTVTVAVAGAGTTTVSRTAGADTIKVTFWILWL